MNILQYFDRNMLLTMISALIYLLLLCGLLLLLRKRIASMIAVLRARKRLPPERAPGGKQTDSFMTHIDNVLAASMKKPFSATTFCVLSISLFFLVFIASAKTLAPGAALITGFAFAGLPYLYLRMRLEKVRRAGSFEGEKLMSAFLTNYLVSSGNIYETIERVVLSCPHLKITGRLLSHLLMTLRNTGDPDRIRKAADGFSFGVGTSWSAMLAYVISTGAILGTDMSAAIEDILSQLREARVLAEERKRLNGESVRMAVWLTPALYVGSLFVAVCVMGLSPIALLHNQFFTAEGFAFFSVGLFLFLLNRVLLESLTNKKLDF